MQPYNPRAGLFSTALFGPSSGMVSSASVSPVKFSPVRFSPTMVSSPVRSGSPLIPVRQMNHSRQSSGLLSSLLIGQLNVAGLINLVFRNLEVGIIPLNASLRSLLAKLIKDFIPNNEFKEAKRQLKMLFELVGDNKDAEIDGIIEFIPKEIALFQVIAMTYEELKDFPLEIKKSVYRIEALCFQIFQLVHSADAYDKIQCMSAASKLCALCRVIPSKDLLPGQLDAIEQAAFRG